MTGDDLRLSEAKRRLLHKYLQGDFRRAPAGKAISPRPPGSIIPLSSGQQQLWLHAQLAAGFPVYNQPITVYRKGPLDVPNPPAPLHGSGHLHQREHPRQLPDGVEAHDH